MSGIKMSLNRVQFDRLSRKLTSVKNQRNEVGKIDVGQECNGGGAAMIVISLKISCH